VIDNQQSQCIVW